ncbi:3-dehydroquinate synthase [Anaeroselena agilis]|uniref:3-dehydroquinate synthase n=1 Tax=Anaeroselena agilis TaxID=3063788 RepID=A0ABU3NYB5_9FIRM|nr:3-dehydroquinate synthase [Selenomonadales bacterium 4137-cl]
MAEVNVNLPGGGYAIYIEPGGLDLLGERISRLNLGDRALVVTDAVVADLYGERALAALRRAGVRAGLAVIPPGEESKSLAAAEGLYTQAIEGGLDRRSPIIAVGGGVVGDLAGFVAATYLRGVPFIQVPTTLLAQVDSSVGGKVAVNHPAGKNLIGAFYQPRLVVADVAVLATLPARELASGLAEVVKYGVIADAAFFAWLGANSEAILARDAGVLGEIVRRSCEIKAAVVEQDEKESHLRMILNFGHTIGHAVEAATGFARYTHGEGVAIGMYGAALLASLLGRCGRETVENVAALLGRFGLPTAARGCRAEDLTAYLARDKKSIGGVVNWVLPDGIGRVTICGDVPDEAVRQVLAAITG